MRQVHRGEGGGWGWYSDLCLLSELFLVQTFEFRNVLSVKVFFQLFYWYVCQFEQVFLWVCQFSQEFCGCPFKNVYFYGVYLIQVTIIFGFIDYSRFPLPIKSTRSSPIKQSGIRRARSAEVVGVV